MKIDLFFIVLIIIIFFHLLVKNAQDFSIKSVDAKENISFSNIIPSPTIISDCSLKTNGDANCDGSVDEEDFIIWRCEFIGKNKCSSPISEKNADFDTSQNVDMVDFEIWRRYVQIHIPQISPTSYITPTEVTPTSADSPTFTPIPTFTSYPSLTPKLTFTPVPILTVTLTPAPTTIPAFTPTPTSSPIPNDFLLNLYDELKKIILAKLVEVLQIYYIDYQHYVPENDPNDNSVDWIQLLVNSRIMSGTYAYFLRTWFKPENCNTLLQKGICYRTDSNNAILFVKMEYPPTVSKCTTGITNLLWSSADNGFGIVCLPEETNQLSNFTYL